MGSQLTRRETLIGLGVMAAGSTTASPSFGAWLV
jgi:hypothetical protein